MNKFRKLGFIDYNGELRVHNSLLSVILETKGRIMALYKFFLIRDGQILDEIKRHLADDLEALDSARTLCREHVVEVYEEIRLVARVKQHNGPLTVTDSRSGSAQARTDG
jgi:hypothetical protein